MINERHLAVIRAALKYWDEEMSPSGSQAFDHYADDRSHGISVADVREARELLANVKLGFVLVDLASDRIVSDEVSYDGELSYQVGQARVAAMLIPNSVA